MGSLEAEMSISSVARFAMQDNDVLKGYGVPGEGWSLQYVQILALKWA
jgi:hypothetical protein